MLPTKKRQMSTTDPFCLFLGQNTGVIVGHLVVGCGSPDRAYYRLPPCMKEFKRGGIKLYRGFGFM